MIRWSNPKVQATGLKTRPEEFRENCKEPHFKRSLTFEALRPIESSNFWTRGMVT